MSGSFIIEYIGFVTFFFLPIIILGATVYLFIRAFNKSKKRTAELQILTSQHGFVFQQTGQVTAKGSYSSGHVSNVISGQLTESKNVFNVYDQVEIRGSGKNSRTYYRTVMQVKTPDIRSQFVINSKLNDSTATGGNLEFYHESQAVVLEGNFSDFFEVFVPGSQQQEVRVMLSPDVMDYFMQNLSNYDIEVIDQELYVYAYQELQPQKIMELITMVDEFIRRARLRSQDVRTVDTGAKVSRIATETVAVERLRSKKRFAAVSIFIFIIVWLSVAYSNVTGKDTTYVFILIFIVIILVLVWSIIKSGKNKALQRKFDRAMRSKK